MTDPERDDLLERLERKIDEQGGALKAQREELNAIRVVLTRSLARAYEDRDQCLDEHEERISALERAAG